MSLFRSFKFITALCFVFSGILSAQQLNRIDYTYYTSWFSQTEHIPVVVEYTLTAEHLACDTRIERAKKFYGDPAHHIDDLNPDYKNSGYDRGHNMSAADNGCDPKGMKECFYFSNMTPQPHSFNAGRWEDLEKIERDEAKRCEHIIVTCGSLGKAKTIGKDQVVVPEHMWKVIYIPRQQSYQCYLFPNTDHVNKQLEAYVVPRSEIEFRACVVFKNGMVSIQE